MGHSTHFTNKARVTAWKISSSFSSLPSDFLTISFWLHSAFRKWIKTRKWEHSTLVQTKSTAHDRNVFHICFYQCGHNVYMHILTTLPWWKKAPKHTLKPVLSNHVAYLYLRTKLSEIPLSQQPYTGLLPLPQWTSLLLNSHHKLPPPHYSFKFLLRFHASYFKTYFQAFIFQKACIGWSVDYKLENTIKRWPAFENKIIIIILKKMHRFRYLCRKFDKPFSNSKWIGYLSESFQTSFYYATFYVIFALNSEVQLSTQKTRDRLQRSNERLYQGNLKFSNTFIHSTRQNLRITINSLPWTTVR